MVFGAVTLKPDAQLNSKRLFINVSSLIESSDHLLSTWNELVRSNEISFDAGSLLNENLQLKVCGCKCEQLFNKCDFCLRSQNEFKQKSNFRSNDFLKDWIWMKQPSSNELKHCINKMIEEQRQNILKISNDEISIHEMKMLLIVTKRFFISFQKSQMKYFRNRIGSARSQNLLTSQTKKIENTDNNQLNNNRNEEDFCQQPHLAVLDALKKIGLKTTLNFVFIFLQKSWKSEEDAIMCNLLLNQLLESIQNLQIGSLFDLETLPAIWLESISRIEHFLYQIILGKLELIKECDIPINDKKLALATLLEITLQKGRLSKILEFIILLNSLANESIFEKSKTPETSKTLTNAPFVCSLARLQSFNAFEQQKSLKSPIGSFLHFSSLPKNPEALVALDSTAVFLMCQLSRLSEDLLKKFHKSRNISQRNLYVFGSINYYGQFYTQSNNDSFHSKLIVKQIVCALSLFIILSDCGLVYSMQYDCDNFLAKPIYGFGNRKVISISSNFGAEHFLALSENGEVFSWGNGKDGRLGHGDTRDSKEPKIINELSDKNIVFIACGSNFSAAISNIGILFTWGHSGYGRLGHGTIEDCLYPTAVAALVDYHVTYVSCGSKDAHTLCCTKDGKLFSWGDGDYGKLGRGGSAPSKLPKLVEELDKEFITQVCCGDQFSIALSDKGHVYSWGKGDDYRLGHETEDHVRYPKLIEALRLVKIIRVSTAATHVLAVSEQGDVYAWGKNDHFQVLNAQEFLIPKPTLISYHRDINAKNIATGIVQSFIWSDYISFKFADRAKFVLEISNDTFVFLQQLLKLGHEKLIEKNGSFLQSLELIVISTFDILNLHFSYILFNNENNGENINHYDPFDLNGKFSSLIIYFATNDNVLKTVQSSAQEVLKNSWKLLFASIEERIKTLSFTLNSSNDNFDKYAFT